MPQGSAITALHLFLFAYNCTACIILTSGLLSLQLEMISTVQDAHTDLDMILAIDLYDDTQLDTCKIYIYMYLQKREQNIHVSTTECSLS